MAYSELRVPFGEKDGRLFTPDEVERGLACGCYCPSCAKPLIANKPKAESNRRNYFSHHRSAECPGGYETALHRMAKQIIEDAGAVVIPEHNINLDAHVIDEEHLTEVVTFPPREVQFIQIQAEQQAEQWRPDLTGTLKNGQLLYVEIKVTHAVEDPKAKALDNLMEIDLSFVEPEVVLDFEELKKRVLFDAYRYWYRCSLYDNMRRLAVAKETLAKRAEAQRQKRLREKAAAQAKELEKIRYERHREEKREQYQGHLDKAYRMQNVKEQQKLHDVMETRCADALWEIQRRLHTAGHAPKDHLPFGVGNHFNGDWIVRTHYLVWQSFVLERFILNVPLGTKFTVPDVVKAVDHQFGYIKWMKELADLKLEGKRKGRERGTWYADTGVWFLSESENRMIKTPYHLMLQYLQFLAEVPYGYLAEVRNAYSFVVEKNRPMDQYNEYARIRKHMESRESFRRQERADEQKQLRELQEREAEEARRQYEADIERMNRNLDVAEDLYRRGTKEALICAYCHALLDELGASQCPHCKNLDLRKVKLTEDYLYSYPYRLQTMPKIWRGEDS